MPRSRREPESDIHHIREDLDSLRTNVASLTRNISSELKSETSQQIMKVKEKSADSLTRLEKHVKAKPAQSLLAAFGAGLAISALMRRH